MSMVKAAAFSRIRYLEAVHREEYISICEQAAEKAGRAGCDIFVLPELFDSCGSIETSAQDNGIYDEKSDRSELCRAVAENIPGPMTERFGRICKKYSMYIAANYYEKENSRLFNTCVLLDRKGRITGKYRKTHLCGSEPRVNGTSAGDDLPVFDTDFGKVGITICMDMNYPEIYRILTLKGAEVILWPHQTYGPTEEIVLLQARARALDNCCYIIGADFASPEPFAPYTEGHALLGRATVINPDGVIIADSGHAPGLAIAEFDPKRPRLTKDVVCIRKNGIDDFGKDIIRTRRPELYTLITEKYQIDDDKDYFEGQ